MATLSPDEMKDGGVSGIWRRKYWNHGGKEKASTTIKTSCFEPGIRFQTSKDLKTRRPAGRSRCFSVSGIRCTVDPCARSASPPLPTAIGAQRMSALTVPSWTLNFKKILAIAGRTSGIDDRSRPPLPVRAREELATGKSTNVWPTVFSKVWQEPRSMTDVQLPTSEHLVSILGKIGFVISSVSLRKCCANLPPTGNWVHTRECFLNRPVFVPSDCQAWVVQWCPGGGHSPIRVSQSVGGHPLRSKELHPVPEEGYEDDRNFGSISVETWGICRSSFKGLVSGPRCPLPEEVVLESYHALVMFLFLGHGYFLVINGGCIHSRLKSGPQQSELIVLGVLRDFLSLLKRHHRIYS